MAQLLFQEALLNYFVNKREKYYLEKNMLFKISLIVNNASGHSPFHGDLYPNRKVVFCSLNTTSVTQAKDLGNIAAFKAEEALCLGYCCKSRRH